MRLIAADEKVRDAIGGVCTELSVPQRRRFMAEIVSALGEGGQRWAQRVLKWNRATIRKGQWELENHPVEDQVHRRGRKSAEHHLPSLLDDIKVIADPVSQQDCTFRTTQLYCPLTGKSVREELLSSYDEQTLPTVRTIRTKLNALNYKPTKVAKSKPLKKIPQTDAIFGQVHKVNAQADQTKGVLRISMDTKAAIKVGPFSRGGYNRRKQKAADHDFKPECVLKLFGILVPCHDQPFFFFNDSSATPDLMIDSLQHIWPKLKTEYQAQKLLINLDNGPENHSRRTQFVKRIVDFSTTNRVAIDLAYYPPYHSKYNSIERVWGVLENRWNGELLDSPEKVYKLGGSMTWKGKHPEVHQIPGTYEKGVTLSKQEMAEYETRLERLQGLEPWFVSILP